MKMSKLCLAISASMLFSASAAFAAMQHQEGDFGLTVQAGHLGFADARNYEGATVPQAGAIYDISKRFSVEAMFGLFHTKSTVTGQPGSRGVYYSLNGLWFIENQHFFQPYLTAGVGAFNLKPNGLVTSNAPYGEDPRVTVNVNAGAGVMLFLNKDVALRLEGKDIYTPRGSHNDFLVNGGFTIYFGNLLNKVGK